MRSILATFTAIALFATPTWAQFAFDASSAAAFPGDSVTVSVNMDNSSAVRGFSTALAHNAAVLTLTGIDQGAALAATNSNAGAEFFFVDTNPPGGPGGVIGSVISLNTPLDELPIGTGQEVAILTYTLSATATPGTSTPVTFSNALGSPPVEIVISVGGVSMFPTTSNGSVSILNPAVTNLSCTLVDPCSCTFDLSWNNTRVYDSIEIFENGVSAGTVAGTATSASVTLTGGFGTSTLSVVASAGGSVSPPTDCIADCPVIAAPAAPSLVNCTVNHANCTATVTWTNNDSYSAIDVSVAGTLAITVAGSATTATVSLGGPGTFDVCLNGSDEFGCVPFAEVCCTVTCFPPFRRGDCNDDGSIDVSDPIRILGFAFLAEAAGCLLALDTNDDESIGIADAMYSLAMIFQGGPNPPAPFAICGADPTPGGLGCVTFSNCP